MIITGITLVLLSDLPVMKHLQRRNIMKKKTASILTYFLSAFLRKGNTAIQKNQSVTSKKG